MPLGLRELVHRPPQSSSLRLSSTSWSPVARVALDQIAQRGVALLADGSVGLVTVRAASRTSSTWLRGSSAAAAISSSLGSPSFADSSRSARTILRSRWPMCTGIRIVRALLASPRWIAWRIQRWRRWRTW